MRFEYYVGIDYSGAKTATSSLKGLRVYVAEGGSPPKEALPPPSRKKYWTRRGIAEWLVTRLGDTPTVLVGIDHGFSFPLRYFETHPPRAGLGIVPRRFPAALADGRRSRLCRFRPQRQCGQRCGAWWQAPLAALDRGAGWIGEIGVPFRRPGAGGEVYACRDSLAALPPPGARGPSTFLAVRRVGHPGRAVGRRRGLPILVERKLCAQ